MTLSLIITICILILIAYSFDITSKHTKIPTVIFLLLLGYVVKKLVVFFELKIVDLSALLPIFGTIGLILIVLEGALELQLNKKKLPVIKKSLWSAVLPLVTLCLVIGVMVHLYTGDSLLDSFLNAAPFCVISSAIAIPSVQNLNPANKEFVIYESSMSDIIGVILFSFLIGNEVIEVSSFLHFGFQLLLILIISFIASVALAVLIKEIDHHVKMIPIMVMVVFVYAIAKIYHLPALLFILILGLFLNNLDEMKHFTFIKKLDPTHLDLELRRFAILAGEAAFLIRTIFFLLFGYFIKAENLLDLDTLPYALIIVGLILLVRFVQLKITKTPLRPMLFIAPRGLITIMLFLEIPYTRKVLLMNESLLMQVIVLTILIMMFGIMFHKPADLPETSDQVVEPEFIEPNKIF